MSNIPQTHLFTPEDLSTFEYNQIFSCCSIWYEENMNNQIATFDLFIRDLPEYRNFFVFGGLEEVIEGIRKWNYTPQQIEFLLDYGIITPKFADYLKHFKFSGDIWAMPEGTVFFPGEPVIRITAPIIEANLLTMFLIESVCSNTIFLSKAVRCVLASAPKDCAAIWGTRAHSFESSMKSARNSYIAGGKAIACTSFLMKYNLPKKPGITIGYHAFIKSFSSELEAMRAIAKYFPDQMMPMVDTYEVVNGVKNAIIVAKELKSQGKQMAGVMLDSGDLYELSIMTRKMLDDAGLTELKINVASNLDEYKITELRSKNAPIDSFLVVTEGVTVADAPKLEVVLKMAQLEENGKIRSTAKFAPGKLSYPGVKQVYRVGNFEKDVIGLTTEKLGTPLLLEILNKGVIKYNLPTMDQIKDYVKNQLSAVPEKLLSIEKCHDYKVDVSDGLVQLLEHVRSEHVKN